MSDFIDLRLGPALWLLLDWSLRWGVLIVAIGLWFAVRPPRQASLRLAACQLVLVAGLLMPLVPHWWGAKLLPNRWVSATDDVAPEQLAAESAEPLPRPSIAKSTAAIVEDRARSAVGAEPARADIATMQLSSSAAPQSAQHFGAGRIVVLIAAALWTVGACVQLIRLVAGAIWLSRLPRSARQPNPESQELFDRCREGMGLRRRVRLGIHSALTAPVFVGGWRALVLVPSGWEQLDPDAQRAVLWHELAHVARRDDWAKLAEEAIRAVFFFHPLVYWLLNRVDVYREQVCDAAAVQRGVAGQMLAQILVDFSRRSALPGQRDAALRPALPFFRRRTVRNRIRELLEENTVARWSAPLVRHQIASLVVIAISIGFALGGFGARASESQSVPVQLAALDPPAKSVPSPAPEKGPAATKGARVPTLERILANWKARQERNRSVYFAWESRTFFGKVADLRSQGKAFSKRADARSRLIQSSFWAEEPDRCRFDSTPLGSPHAVRMHLVMNGATTLSVEGLGDAADLSVCHATAGGGHWRRIAPTQLLLTVRPLDAFVGGHQFRVVTENALVAGLRCVELQNAKDNNRWLERCWVDPARDDIVVADELQFHPKDQDSPKNTHTISIQYRHDPVHGWVPAAWTSKQPGELSEDKVTKYAINEPIPAETFSLKLAPGTLVFDQRTSEQYRVAKDGSKSDVVKGGSLTSLRILEALASKSDFQIQPQTLKEAVDFIAARYQIPILLNQKEFAQAGIDLASEVQVAREGMVVADVLKSVLGQGQKPAGFRIEDEVLKISPKFVGQEPIHVRPAPVAPKLESPQARTIREALEMPVDFVIEPQSLKDAVEFLAARYQIKIVIDKTVASKTEVHGSAPGIRLRSLLSILLEQLPKPTGFKIEDDALKIYPEVAAP
ncbi:MAG TPA: M56 family metallopeptidase [Planctomycetaceae bacterium]|jgi:beta-lactamase regulating signal transducer with metallopeptidase domain|nr:M56 family metallopeptidase [Planctomycetaceae bacterium]